MFGAFWHGVPMPRFLTLFLAASFIVAAQNQNHPVQQNPAETMFGNLPTQTIGADDMINLSVYDSPEFSRSIRVGPDGMIRMPMLKQKIKAQGLLPSELEVSIAAALVDEQLLVDPFVTVTVSEYHSRPISVVGAVKNPLTFQAVGTVTLIDALTRAGGLTDDAQGEILVSRTGADKKTSLVQRIPTRTLIDSPDPEMNLRLTGGEEIRVPQAPRVIVAGNVRRPGSYAIKENSEMTVQKAIAMAEGLSQYWGGKAYIYRPDDSTGKKNEISVPLREIMTRKADDIPLMARDILYIPDSTGKRSLDRILGVAGSAATGLVIYH
jgi:polysaccharide export outer membrane protein